MRNARVGRMVAYRSGYVDLNRKLRVLVSAIHRLRFGQKVAQW